MVELAENGAAPVASSRIATELADRILSGRLEPGARIKQDEIAAEFSASRIPVREALRILESRGLLVLKSNSGAWVSQMSLHDLSMSYRIRERIEPLLLLDSLPRLVDADLDEMREVQAEIEATTDVDRFLVLDRRFHWASYRGHRSPALAAMVERLWDTTQSYRREFTRLTANKRAWVISSEHMLLIEAVASRNPETAESILETHIRRTRLELQQHPELFDDPAL
jgi:DNA-binding GntR family transcriptional regulator